MGRDCHLLSESPKPATSLTMTAQVSGTFTGDNGGTPETITYSGTQTKTVTRVPFDGRTFYTDGTHPPDGKFNLLCACCCYQCRFSLLFNLGQDIFFFTDAARDFNWTSSGGGSGTTTAAISFANGFPTGPEGDSGEATFPGSSRTIFCTQPDEAGRSGQPSNGNLSAPWEFPAFFVIPPLSWTYVDDAGGSTSGSGYTGDVAFPGPAPTFVKMTSCADTQSWTATLHFTGTATVAGVTSTVNFTIALTFALT